jgi:uncharacterized repeat protein (TIGR01451 family)
MAPTFMVPDESPFAPVGLMEVCETEVFPTAGRRQLEERELQSAGPWNPSNCYQTCRVTLDNPDVFSFNIYGLGPNQVCSCCADCQTTRQEAGAQVYGACPQRRFAISSKLSHKRIGVGAGQQIKYTVKVTNTKKRAAKEPIDFTVQLPTGVTAERQTVYPSTVWTVGTSKKGAPMGRKSRAPVTVVVDAQANTVTFQGLVLPPSKSYSFKIRARVSIGVPASTQLTFRGALYQPLAINQQASYCWDEFFTQTVRVKTGKAAKAPKA